jgi:bridging integrator 3
MRVGRADTKIAMTRSQMAIAETIDAFYGDAGANDGVSRSYKQAVADLDAETIKALDGPYRYMLSSWFSERPC